MNKKQTPPAHDAAKQGPSPQAGRGFGNPSMLPRERLTAFGPQALRMDELLAILLKTGTHGLNVLDLANRIIDAYPTPKDLSRAMPSDLMQFPGLGHVKAVELAAAIELGKRIADSSLTELKIRLDSPERIVNQIRIRKFDDDTESFYVVPLSKKLSLSGPITEMSRGTLDASIVHPRDVFRTALKWSASSIIVAHNHPSGDPSPSGDDICVTENIVNAGRIMEIPVLDHIIVGDPDPGADDADRRSGFVSMRRKNRRLFA